MFLKKKIKTEIVNADYVLCPPIKIEPENVEMNFVQENSSDEEIKQWLQAKKRKLRKKKRKHHSEKDVIKSSEIPLKETRNKIEVELKPKRKKSATRTKSKKEIVDCNCKRMCFEGIPVSLRESLRVKVHSMTNEERNRYCMNLIETKEPKYFNKNAVKRRDTMYRYFLLCERGDKINVCRTAFQNILGITPSKVHRLCQRLTEGRASDLRGITWGWTNYNARRKSRIETTTPPASCSTP